MYIESWTTTTFDGETFQQMTTSGSEGIDASIGLTTEARQPWFLLNSIKEFEFVGGGFCPPCPDTDTRPDSGMLYPRGF